MNLLKKTVWIGLFASAAFAVAAPAAPSLAELQKRLRTDHPRLFINRDTLPAFKARLNGACAPQLAAIRKTVDGYPQKVELEYKTENVNIVDGKMVFKRVMGDQNAVAYGLRQLGGNEAVKCALVYLATGEKVYLRKAVEYLRLSIQFIRLAQRSRILPEWYHYSRQNALIAYDWLFRELSEAEKREFIVPMLEYVDYMQQGHGYQRNGGGTGSGNYGEGGLMWYAGLAAWKDGYADELAQSLLERGYRQQCDMMELREAMSEGTGLLVHITTGYTLGAYPWASCNFLHTLKSAAGLDMTDQWTQMRDYPLYFAAMAIPDSTLWDGFHEYGWGDSGHTSNGLTTGLMYNHMAQVIHLYGKRYPQAAERARAVIELLPEKRRAFSDSNQHAYLPFILDGFDPAVRNERKPSQVLGEQTAFNFRKFGLTVMRSGFGEGDTYASFKGGSSNEQHQHYDENSFVIYKRGFQALDTGTRNNAPHHLIYYPQSIAHNTILIRMENEPLAKHWYPANAPRIAKRPDADGGQNFHCQAQSLGVDSSEFHAVTGGDATACYSAKKCREAVRQFVFVKPDYFVIYDRVTSVEPGQQKVFLLHSQGEFVQRDGVWRSTGGEGALFTRTLLPRQAAATVIGGDGQEFMTGGVNYPIDGDSWVAKAKGQTWAGRYRLEVSPAQNAEKARFLHLLQAADKGVKAMTASRLVTTETQDGVVFTTADGTECTVMFRRDGNIGGHLTLRRDGKVLLDRPLLEERPVGLMQPLHAVYDPRESARLDMYMATGRLQEKDKGTTARLERPRWLNKGESFSAHFAAGKTVERGHFTVQALTDGVLTVRLMGPDIRVNDVMQPYRVVYSEFSINGKPYLAEPVTVWHNDVKLLKIPVKAGETLRLEAAYRTLGLVPQK